MAADTLAAGSADFIVAGGMESMTNAPYLMKKHRAGARIGHDTVYDHMILDGLEDAYEAGRPMGTFAEDTAARISVHPRQPGRLCDRLPDPRPDRPARPAGSTREIVAVEVEDPQGRGRGRQGRAAAEGRPEQDPRPQARFRQGRHDHRRQRLLHLATAPPLWSSPAPERRRPSWA